MDLKIVSFNIRCCDDENGHSIQERAPRLFSILRDISPDVIGFQEYTEEWKPLVEAELGEEYEIFNQWRCVNNHESCPLLWKKSRFSCNERGVFWLSDTPEEESGGWDECGCFRLCEYAILCDKRSGVSFNAMNTHFGFGDECQTKSAELIINRMAMLSDLPSFVTGDFNMKPDSAGYKVITGALTDANAVTDKDFKTTYHGYQPEKEDTHIDYCFVNGGVTPETVKTIRRTFDGKFPSDHFGLEIEIEL